MRMEISKIIVEKVITARPDDKISKILSDMEKWKIHQVPILNDKEHLEGMLFLNDIVLEDVDPSITKAATLMRRDIPSLKPNSSEKEAAKLIIETGIRAVPICEKNKLFGIISETDLMDFVRSNAKAADIMTESFTIGENESIGKAKKLMKDMNVSRLPLVDNDSNIVGVLDTLDLIKVFKPKSRQTRTVSGPGENIQLSNIPVKSIMRMPELSMIGKDADMSKITEVLKKTEEAIVTDGRKILGIITPKDVIELLVPKEKEGRIQIANVSKDDEITRHAIFEVVENWLKKSAFNADYIFIYVHKHKTNGRVKYSLHARLGTDMGMVVARSIGWDAQSSAQDLVEKLHRIIEKKRGKILDRKKKREKFLGEME